MTAIKAHFSRSQFSPVQYDRSEACFDFSSNSCSSCPNSFKISVKMCTGCKPERAYSSLKKKTDTSKKRFFHLISYSVFPLSHHYFSIKDYFLLLFTNLLSYSNTC